MKCANCETETGPFVAVRGLGKLCKPGVREVVDHGQTHRVPDVRACLARRDALDKKRYDPSVR